MSSPAVRRAQEFARYIASLSEPPPPPLSPFMQKVLDELVSDIVSPTILDRMRAGGIRALPFSVSVRGLARADGTLDDLSAATGGKVSGSGMIGPAVVHAGEHYIIGVDEGKEP